MLGKCRPVFMLLFDCVRWTPVVFVCLVLSWAYYAYVVELCFLTVENLAERLVYLAMFHILLILLMWSYMRTCFTPMPAPPPDKFRLPAFIMDDYLRATTEGQNEILEHFARDLPLNTRSHEGKLRYCSKCASLKPDRAHHCGVCGVCLLKMDHHCPWVNACVHFGNYKFFILFLGYGLLFCMFVFFTDMRFFIQSWQPETGPYNSKLRGRFQILFLFFVAGMFSISVSFLFFYHLFLTAKNRSTVEACYAPTFRYGHDKNGFNLGISANFHQVFGPFSWKAFLPLTTWPGDGVAFPMRRGLPSQRYYESLANNGENHTMTGVVVGEAQQHPLGNTQSIDRQCDRRLPMVAALRGFSLAHRSIRPSTNYRRGERISKKNKHCRQSLLANQDDESQEEEVYIF